MARAAEAALARAALERARGRLDTLGWYPRPVRTARVRLLSAPWLFRVPGLRRFHGCATWGLILVRRPLAETHDDLVVHELCHVWQLQHQPLRMPLTYLVRRYETNPYEIEARRAVVVTRARP